MRKRTNILKNILNSSYTYTIIGIFIVFFISLPLYKNIRSQMEVNDEIATLEKEINSLEKKNTELKGLISYLSSDEFAEEQARLNLNFKKEGEEVIVIKDETVNREGQEIDSIYNIKGLDVPREEKKRNNAINWLDYFWGNE